MKSFVLFFILITSFSVQAQIRVFFFNRTSDGSATFRLQCVGTEAANRCTDSQFRTRARSLCEDDGLVLGNVQPFNCVTDIDTNEQFCKYTNGDCVKPATSQVTKERPSLEEENPAVPELPTVEDLPETQQLPEIEPAAEIRPLPDNESLPEVQQPREVDSPRQVSPMPQRDTSLPTRQGFPEVQ